MNSFYNIIDKIKEVIVAEPFNNEITFGDIADIDLKKQSLFPLSHVMINNSTINTTRFSISRALKKFACSMVQSRTR